MWFKCFTLLVVALCVVDLSSVLAQDAPPSSLTPLQRRRLLANRRAKLLRERLDKVVTSEVTEAPAVDAATANPRRRLVTRKRTKTARKQVVEASTAAPRRTTTTTTTTTTEAPVTATEAEFEPVVTERSALIEFEDSDSAEIVATERPDNVFVFEAPVFTLEEPVAREEPATRAPLIRPSANRQRQSAAGSERRRKPAKSLNRRPVPVEEEFQDVVVTSRPEPAREVSRPRVQSARKETTSTTPHSIVETIRRYSFESEDGSFTFGYESADGSFKEETRGADCIVRGKYGYVDPDGVKREFSYESGNRCDPNRQNNSEEVEDVEEDRRPNTPRSVSRPNTPRPAAARPTTARPLPTTTRRTTSREPANLFFSSAATESPRNVNVDFDAEVQRLTGSLPARRPVTEAPRQRPAPSATRRPIFDEEFDPFRPETRPDQKSSPATEASSVASVTPFDFDAFGPSVEQTQRLRQQLEQRRRIQEQEEEQQRRAQEQQRIAEEQERIRLDNERRKQERPQEQPLRPQQQFAGPQQQFRGPQQQFEGPQQQFRGPQQQFEGPQQQFRGPQQQFEGPQQQFRGPQQQFERPQQQFAGPQQQFRGPPQQQFNPNFSFDPSGQFRQQQQQQQQQQFFRPQGAAVSNAAAAPRAQPPTTRRPFVARDGQQVASGQIDSFLQSFSG